MITFVYELIAILLFLKFADFRLLRHYTPIIITTVFIRFLDHYIVIDWFKVWEIVGPSWTKLWLPLSANVTTWPIALFLYVQYLPKRRKLLYSFLWVGGMTLYIHSLIWLHVIQIKKSWHFGASFASIGFTFLIIYFLWQWLSKGAKPLSKTL